MSAGSFWIGLPDGWNRTALDPEYQQRVRTTLADTERALPQLASQCATLQDLLNEAASHDTEGVLFAAEYFASPEAGQCIHCVLAISYLPADELPNIEPNWFDTSGDEEDAKTKIRAHRLIGRRTSFETGAENLGIDTTATVQYFVESPDTCDALVISFSSTSVGYWAELLEVFDAIVSTVDFIGAR